MTSPLAETNVNSLDELFSRFDAGATDDASVDAIVDELRRKRETWATKEAMPKAPRGRPAGNKLDLSSLDIE